MTKPTRRSIISIPSSIDLGVKKFAESVKENVDVLLGHRGNPEDRAITWRDLSDSGLVNLPAGFSGLASQAVGNVGTTITNVVSENEILGTIQVPTNLTATGAFQNILLSWNLTSYVGHSHVEIWRHTSDSLSDASLVGISSLNTGLFADNVGSNSTARTYYYWVRAVNTANSASAFNSSSGTSGTLGSDVDTLVTTLNNSIPATAFATGIEPISVVNALPAVSGYSGPNTVFLTTDKKLYRYDSTVPEWTNAVPTTDLSGTITTDQLADDSVSVGKLLVTGRGAALNSDPNFQDPSAWVKYPSWSQNATFTTISDGVAGNSVMRSGTSATWYNGSERIPFDPNKTYRVRGIARRNSAANGSLYIGVALFTSTGANIGGDGTQWSYDAAQNVTPNTTFTAYSAEFGAGTSNTFPSNARTMAPLTILNLNGSAGYVEIQDLRIEEKVGGDLVVDGSITANHVASNAITANAIAAGAITAGAISAGAINASNIIADGVIVGDKIAANTITGAKIQAGTVNADRIQTGTLSASQIATGTLNTANVNISGTSSSGINIKSASSGSRMEILSKVIKIYDGNSLRVKLGEL